MRVCCALLCFGGWVLAVLGNIIDEQQEQRAFGYRYTKTITKSVTVTSLVPSSCVQVAASLPPCRNLRMFSEIPGFRQHSKENSTTPPPAESSVNYTTQPVPKIESTTLTWLEYLGILPPTVTVTSTYLKTALVHDPKVLVTYSIKGCKPARLPADLNLCPENIDVTAQEGTVPTRVSPKPPPSTILPSLTPGGNTEEEVQGGEVVEEELPLVSMLPTEGLPEHKVNKINGDPIQL